MDDIQRELRDRAEQITRANDRARALLMAHLDVEQRWDLLHAHHFFVEGSDGRRYCIRTGLLVSNVLCAGGAHCAVLDGPYPAWDHFLAQMLILQTNAEYFRSVAK